MNRFHTASEYFLATGPMVFHSFCSLVSSLAVFFQSVLSFRDKDKIYKQYRAQVDKLFDRFDVSASNKKLSSFKTSISNMPEGSSQTLYREREKLVRTCDNMKAELQTYENNLGFLNASSKKGSNLLTELNRKVEKLKNDIELVKQKIKVIDENIKNGN